ncbi:MAG: hypothetical protein PWQ55_2530 [Chloroflexota bacterium]|nr:hypothetical protein [Chloroflexota bacterium]
MKNFLEIGIQAPDVLLPAEGVDYTRWAVVACDQYTSEPQYWREVEELVGDAPSTYHLILPEAYLGTDKEAPHQARINPSMREYMEKDVLAPKEGFIFTERAIGDRQRLGLIVALDLEQYSFERGSKSLVRATEGTILDRLPPRIKIRKDALLEIPHILVLIDDPQGTVIEPLQGAKSDMEKLYDFDLMQSGGHITGYRIQDADTEKQIVAALQALLQPSLFQEKYGVDESEAPFLFAVGDGNHSLATAKSVWDQVKASRNENDPARFALVELVNIHDPAMQFEPIHRLLKNPHVDLAAALQAYFSAGIDFEDVPDFAAMKKAVMLASDAAQKFGLITPAGFQLATIREPQQALTVGSVQAFLDELIAKKELDEVDYVHGDEIVRNLGSQPGHAGIFLPVMQKSQLFEAVIKDGSLPRKTFSMGEANEKRFYLECRQIQEMK